MEIEELAYILFYSFENQHFQNENLARFQVLNTNDFEFSRDIVLASTIDGHLRALDTSNGEIRWTLQEGWKPKFFLLESSVLKIARFEHTAITQSAICDFSKKPFKTFIIFPL